jgi:hypothetical protein
MNGLVAYGSDSEDETEVATPAPPVAVKVAFILFLDVSM